MKTIRCRFYCNGGHTEETVDVEIYPNEGSEENQIQEAFLRWLDQNEDCGWEIEESEKNIEETILLFKR